MTWKNWIPVGLIVSMALLLMGMSGLGSPPQAAIASPFNATIKDTSGNEVSISSATIDGKSTFSGFLGKGKVQIPLENISRIEVTGGEVCVTLSSTGDMCTLRLAGSSKIYGKTSYGSYQIPLKDVVWIEFTRSSK
ncbi:MAG: hypothetical protein ACP5G0_06555 [Desulfomonilia bacterium]